ncbi:MAG: hypothetical protein CVU52_06230 [Deltaproteobacteria bacterium HGW-Deltaproteobacteria-10]|nr:MAG: hypothetical protein CVU52_06230 [Deltaproteobacteria bacterium HGW-Deltaproteobacteria-10]
MAEFVGDGIKLIYACSGAADVGEIADRVARKLRAEGFAKMTCLAGIAAGLSSYLQSAKGTAENITIDGCKKACAKKTLERIEVTSTSYVLTELGLVKGESPVSDEIVARMCEKIKGAGGNLSTAPLVTGGCSCSGKC